MKILILYPNKWGRGITPPWIASHGAVLRAAGHTVHLFDATFYRDWADNETAFNTANGQYRESSYSPHFTDEPVRDALQRVVTAFQPDLVFWSALSSMIHGEGEYAALEHGYELVKDLDTTALFLAGGLQALQPDRLRFPRIHRWIQGESEYLESRTTPLDLASLPPYDYSLFADQVFDRPYNGKVVRAADVEFSRGCPFTCAYCVETSIQKHYGFTESSHGVLKEAKRYLRTKKASTIIEELRWLYEQRGVTLFRCQDTNFLSIHREVLEEIAQAITDWPVKLYIETRPDGIHENNIELLKRLHVDGVGMGIETASRDFRESQLHRFADGTRTRLAFRLLREHGIKRTAYNVIGFPNQTERMIEDTVIINRALNPDNITVAYYSPFTTTPVAGMDPQLHAAIPNEKLDWYKQNFVRLVHESV